jgi:hypothetical protein
VFAIDSQLGVKSAGIGSAVVSLIILLILFSPRANEFFASRS